MRMTVSSWNYISLKLSLMMRSNIYNLKIGIFYWFSKSISFELCRLNVVHLFVFL